MIEIKDANGSLGYDTFVFPAGEVSVRLLRSPCGAVVFNAKIENSEDVIRLLLLKDAIDRELPLYQGKSVELVMKYVPYARQDRVCNKGESLSIKVFANLINSAKFDAVLILDPHSDVTPALFENCYVESNEKYVGAFARENRIPILICPDTGAQKKASKLGKYFEQVVYCDKVRDLSTGELSGFNVNSEDLGGLDCLLVDDICDGGGTFIGLAKELRKKNCGKLHLLVSHGIFSKGRELLEEWFDSVNCINSLEKETK